MFEHLELLCYQYESSIDLYIYSILFNRLCLESLERFATKEIYHFCGFLLINYL
ncbi:hypothetical protein C7392_12511 [Gilliamella apicola]|nr:hypothetical protein C7392_12511 [Gilliamella apicola]